MERRGEGGKEEEGAGMSEEGGGEEEEVAGVSEEGGGEEGGKRGGGLG